MSLISFDTKLEKVELVIIGENINKHNYKFKVDLSYQYLVQRFLKKRTIKNFSKLIIEPIRLDLKPIETEVEQMRFLRYFLLVMLEKIKIIRKIE